VQAVLDVHDTQASPLAVAPVGFGVVWIDQVVPFHRSANVACVPELLVYEPTAVHAVVDVHEDPESAVNDAPVRFGVVWTDQVVPVKRSASVTSTWEPLTPSPTAVQAVLDVHDTEESALEVAPDGVAVLWIDQLVPFQLSANGDCVAGLLVL
jgi:hypothetical protein